MSFNHYLSSLKTSIWRVTTTNKWVGVISEQIYKTPVFVLRETFKAFARHKILGLSAALSYYALFALIPLLLLMLFLLGHLVFSSDYAIVKMAILTSNIVPDLSSSIMVEVLTASKQKAAWGTLGLFFLLWAVTPLASAMRSTFYTICTMMETPSIILGKVKDILAVLGVLLLFFLFTFAGLAIEKTMQYISQNFHSLPLNYLSTLSSFLITAILIALFYLAFLPIRVALKHLLIGACCTSFLWLLVRPTFTLFLLINHNYGAVFGSMKAVFVTITWVYFNFAVFLFGIELIATLRKKDVLLLRGLFDGYSLNKASYKVAISQRYGLSLKMGDYVYKAGNTEHKLYYVMSGTVALLQAGTRLRHLQAGDYFGEMTILAASTNVDAIITSENAELIVVYPEQVETLIAEYPAGAIQFLKNMNTRLQTNHQEMLDQ